MPYRIPTHRPHQAATPARQAQGDAAQREAERKRFYNSAAWIKLRDAFLRANPLCERCHAAGRLTAATVAHHVQERLQRPDLALDWDNLEPVCGSCHSSHHAGAKPRTDLERVAQAAPKPPPTDAAPLVVDLADLVDVAPAARLLDLTPAKPRAIAALVDAASTHQLVVTSTRFAPIGPPDPVALLSARSWLIARGVAAHWITVHPDRSGRIVLATTAAAGCVGNTQRNAWMPPA